MEILSKDMGSGGWHKEGGLRERIGYIASVNMSKTWLELYKFSENYVILRLCVKSVKRMLYNNLSQVGLTN